MELPLLLLGFIFGVCVHEYAHARVAYAGGDHTVVEKGYLDFNPFDYAHPVITFVFPIIFLLLGRIPLPGGAVYIERSLLWSKHWDSAVSAAGPAASLAFGLLLCAAFLFVPRMEPGTAGFQLASVLAVLAYLELFLVLLNLLPIPGLDGFGIMRPYLPREWGEASDAVAPYGCFILFVVMRSSALGGILSDISFRAASLAGVPYDNLVEGYGFLDMKRYGFGW
jgi:Zn-dependent protease